MLLRFTKMHGLGNDFVVIDLVTQRFSLQKKHIVYLADRHKGIGCDQLLTVETPLDPDADFRYRIYNADGDEVEQCGNGARCFALFVQQKKLTGKNTIKVTTKGGLIELNVQEDQQVRVCMGEAILLPETIPFTAEQQANSYQLEVANQRIEIGAISVGNPHAVTRVEDITTAAVESLGPAIENHARFPNRVNVGFMQIIDRQSIKLRVFERGVGETQACGTGACAAMIYGRLQGWLDDKVKVWLTGGSLEISWQSPDAKVFMTGPAQSVYDGKIYI